MTYSYTSRNQLSSVVETAGTTTYSYDANGNETGITNPNSTTVTRVYDAENQLTSVTNKNSSNTTLSSFTYAYNDDGLRTSCTEASGDVVSYGYDGAHRLTSESRTGTTESDVLGMNRRHGVPGEVGWVERQDVTGAVGKHPGHHSRIVYLDARHVVGRQEAKPDREGCVGFRETRERSLQKADSRLGLSHIHAQATARRRRSGRHAPELGQVLGEANQRIAAQPQRPDGVAGHAVERVARLHVAEQHACVEEADHQ